MGVCHHFSQCLPFDQLCGIDFYVIPQEHRNPLGSLSFKVRLCKYALHHTAWYEGDDVGMEEIDPEIFQGFD